MEWHAKPKYGYDINSNEARENALLFYSITGANGWTAEATAATLGNMQHESGMNPWRWQSDSVSMTSSVKGYGLAQFTPAYGYIGGYGVGLPGYGPNMSTSEITSGATPLDGQAQSICIARDTAGKYFIRKWAPTQFKLSWEQYKQNVDLYNGVGAWLYNYESPVSPGSKITERYNSAQVYYRIITGEDPPPPPPMPGGTIPVWLMKKIIDNN